MKDRKRVRLEIGMEFPEDANVRRMSISPDGTIRFLNDQGDEVEPRRMSRTTGYDRAKGPKIQARAVVADGRVSVNGLSELIAFDSIFVMDTNDRLIGGVQVSATAFVCCWIRSMDNGQFEVGCEPNLNVYEFHDVAGNPELLGILKVANVVRASAGADDAHSFAIVTDSELGEHEAINERTSPVYGSHHLPAGFKILYASSDTGREVLNRVIRFCDRSSSDYLDQLENGALDEVELRWLAEDPSVRYAFRSRSGLEIVNPVVAGTRFEEETDIQLYGVPKLESG